MKKLIILIIIITLNFLYAASLSKACITRMIDDEIVLDYTNLGLRVMNHGCVGSFEEASLLYPSLYQESSKEHLFQANLWVSGVKNRRDENGKQLYWLPNAQSENDVVNNDASVWNTDLKPVKDTLTTVGFEGSLDLVEFLPAYNYYESINNLCCPYQEYNTFDVVLHDYGKLAGYDDDLDGEVDEDSWGDEFNFEDENWCFTHPFDDDSDGFCDEDCAYTGFESTLCYFYDYSLFGSEIEHDMGDNSSSSRHYPLELAVKQQTFSYPVQGLEDVVFIQWDITNMSVIDTLDYMSFGFMVDPDIGSVYDGFPGSDDASSYNSANEFAYSYDYDGDSGDSPYMLGTRIINTDYGIGCWTWDVSETPDDRDPANPVPGGKTANEKYWLMSDSNPDDQQFSSLREFPNVATSPHDTRYLYSVYGATPLTGDTNNNGIPDYQETDADGDHFLCYELAPHETKEITAILFMGENVADLEVKCQEAIDFYDSGYDLSLYDHVPSLPVITNIENYFKQIRISWNCPTKPDSLFIKYKTIDESAEMWQYVGLPSDTLSCVIEDITECGFYEFVIESEYGGIYLESEKSIIYFDPDEWEDILPVNELINYPNPFNPSTTIEFALEEEEHAALDVYNIKGHKVKELIDEIRPSGKNTVTWNGQDENDDKVCSGIYLLKLETESKSSFRKIMLIK